MAVDTRQGTAVLEPDTTRLGRRPRGPRWVWIATAVALVALGLALFAVWHGGSEPVREGRVAVYLDPMTSVREAGPYAEPPAPTWVDPMTSVREAGPYAEPPAPTWVDPMTSVREGGTYAGTGTGR
jgi:hypothetical protein